MTVSRFATVIAALAMSSMMLWSCRNEPEEANPATTTQAREPTAQRTPPRRGPPMHAGIGCPMMVQAVDVKVADSPTGVSLTFTTTEGDVADLRARVQHLAQMYEMHRGGGMMWHQMRGGMGPGRGMGPSARLGPIPAATATVVDVDKGARIELAPTVYDVYDSNETLEAKLFAGRSGYDVVFPSAHPFANRHIASKLYAPLDKTKLSNLMHLRSRRAQVAGHRRQGQRTSGALHVGYHRSGL